MAGYYPKKPKLTYREVANQIFLRTGIPPEIIKTVMDVYADITEEALLGAVEVPFGRIGHFSWKQIRPRANVATWDAWNRCYTEPHDVPGFQKTVFRVGAKWASILKEASYYELGQPNPMLFGAEETDVEKKVDSVDDNEVGDVEENEDGE